MEDKEKLNKLQQEAWHTDPKNWKWGIFYYNPEDKRLLPPKKIKSMGWTVNFSNPYSILVMLLIIVLICVLISFLKPLLANLS